MYQNDRNEAVQAIMYDKNIYQLDFCEIWKISYEHVNLLMLSY